MQGKGLDTKMMVPAYVSAFTALSMPYAKSTLSMILKDVSHTDSISYAMQKSTLSMIFNAFQYFMTTFIILSVLLFAIVIIKKEKAVNYVRVYGGIYTVFFVLLSMIFVKTKIVIPTVLLGQFIVILIVSLFAKKLMDPLSMDAKVKEYVPSGKMGRKTKITLLLCILSVPIIIYFGLTYFDNRAYLFIGLLIIGVAMIPFFTAVEEKNPPARELILIAVMSAIAVVGRMAFFMIPQFKPMTAVVIISGIGLGAQAGFLTGVVAAFVSNFFFGQGPWTPWQMFSLGIIGFLAGIIFYKKIPFSERTVKWRLKRKIMLCIYGGLATLIIYGFIMDTSGVLSMQREVTKEMFIAAYASGFPFNVIHAVSTIIFLFIMAEPIEKKLDRIQKKFGI